MTSSDLQTFVSRGTVRARPARSSCCVRGAPSTQVDFVLTKLPQRRLRRTRMHLRSLQQYGASDSQVSLLSNRTYVSHVDQTSEND